MNANEYDVQERVQKDHWWYVGRRKLLRWCLKDITACHGRFSAAIDVGCGVGGSYTVIREFSDHVSALDGNDEALAFVSKKGYDRVIKANLESADAADAGVSDLVVALDVLEHLRDDVAGVRTLRSMLKPDGYLIATVPAFPSLWGLQDEVSHHYRRYRMPEFCALLGSAGFHIVRKSYFNTALFLPILFARRVMRLFRIRSFKSENDVNTPAINAILKFIFLAEIALLRIGVRMPFGVSALVVVKNAP